MRIGLEDQLQTSFPDPANVDKIRQLLVEDTRNDTLGLESHLEGNEIYFTSTNEWLKYPCPMNFSDPKEDEEFDRIGRVMA